MRRVLFILSLFMLVCGCIEARTIIVEIGNIRGNHGNILVMAQSGKDTKPVYGMAKSEKRELANGYAGRKRACGRICVEKLRGEG